MGLRLLQQGKNLLPLHTGKTFEKVCNGVSGLKMVKQTLNRYAGSGEDRLASQDFRVSRNDFLHGGIIAPAAGLCEAKLLPPRELKGTENPEVNKPCRFRSPCIYIVDTV
jgi:hypothetical protein